MPSTEQDLCAVISAATAVASLYREEASEFMRQVAATEAPSGEMFAELERLNDRAHEANLKVVDLMGAFLRQVAGGMSVEGRA